MARKLIVATGRLSNSFLQWRIEHSWRRPGQRGTGGALKEYGGGQGHTQVGGSRTTAGVMASRRFLAKAARELSTRRGSARTQEDQERDGLAHEAELSSPRLSGNGSEDRSCLAPGGGYTEEGLWKGNHAWRDTAGAAGDAGSTSRQFSCREPGRIPGDEREVLGLSVLYPTEPWQVVPARFGLNAVVDSIIAC